MVAGPFPIWRGIEGALPVHDLARKKQKEVDSIVEPEVRSAADGGDDVFNTEKQNRI
jgi:hypothetical protein